MQHRSTRGLFWSSALLAIVAGLFVMTGTSLLRADDNDCQRRISRADHRLHEAIEHHGVQSKQAERARHDLHEAREHCWNNGHRWWDEHDRKWRTERDWDDRDHDRDMDHR